MEIVKYDSSKKDIWNDFVRDSKNGTFLFLRDFMEYHSDRFTDHSFLFYDKNQLLALLPGNLSGDIFYSHQGLTYGGFILSEKIKAVEVLKIFDLLISYLKRQGVSKIIYKPVPHIYHWYPSEEDLYALFRNGAILLSRAVSSTIELNHRPEYSQLRKRKIKKAREYGLQINESFSFQEFWKILEENLLARYNTSPVHSLNEIEYLKQKFPDEIRLFCAKDKNVVIAGCVVFETRQVAHIQYISANQDGKDRGALDLLFEHLINDVYKHKKYFDFGISTENNGSYLNEGLILQKEGFGGRGIVYDIYQLDI